VILGIDSSDEFLSIGLISGSEIIFSRSSQSQAQNKNMLHSFLARSLDEAGIKMAELNGVSVAVGPGSFTGLRVGLAVAKGIAWSLKIPITGVSSLLPIAICAKIGAPQVLAVKDARREEFYYAGYNNIGGIRVLAVPESVGPAKDIGALVEDGYVAIGPGVATLERYLPNFKLPPGGDFDRECIGGAVAQLGKEQFDSGKILDLAASIPNYIRTPRPREWKP
jgi:tRNA threonylcarbamoyladenosine biosynthesis protein TsaB